MTDEAVAKQLRGFFIKILIAFAVLGVTVGVSSCYTYQTAKNNTKALCAIRKDAEDRIKQTNDYLEEHPEGIAGVSAQQLRRSLTNSIRTVKALKDVNCN